MAITVLGRGVVMPLRLSLLSTTMLSGVVGAVFLPVLTVQAADLEIKAPAAFNLPAVDGINWKAEGFGGALMQIAGPEASATAQMHEARECLHDRQQAGIVELQAGCPASTRR